MDLDFKKIDLLVSVSKLYYEHGYNQDMIAKKLGLSRPYISRLIAEARECGIVTVQIHDPTGTETPLERELRARFSLRKVIAIPPVVEGSPLSKLGAACARYLDSILSDGDMIGVTWGATLYASAGQAIRRGDLRDITVVQLCGGISNVERSLYVSEIPKLFADAVSGVPYILPLPAIMDSVQVKHSVLTDQDIARVMEYGARANIALFTLGQFGETNALAHAGYLNEALLQKLDAAGAVGDIGCHFIDEDGRLCDPELDARTIALPLEELKKKDYRIAVAMGDEKVRSLCGALRGGYPNVLITDEDTARGVLDRLDVLEGK